MACVYAHIRPDTDSVFYIGISKTKSRPYSKHNRNNYWKNIVAKCNGEFTVNILYKDLSWEEACKKEIEYIAFYGRVNNSKGVLCNMTDGGEGILNLKHSPEAKLKISIATKERHKLKPHCRKGKRFTNSNSRKVVIINLKTYIIYKFNTLVEAALFLNTSPGKVRRACIVSKSINGYYLKLGNNISDNEIENLKNKKIYELSRMTTNVNKDYSFIQKKVINTETSEIFNSISEVSKRYGITNSTLNRQLRGVSKNKTVFKLL
jgi:hypothetical protein